MSRLVIGVPSKGRLQENAADFFARAGLNLTRDNGARGYQGGLSGVEGVSVRYLSASEIARELASGGLHLGITGEDLIRETIPETDGVAEMLMPLGFGHADVVIAVPAAWIDVDSVADFDDVSIAMRLQDGRVPRIATKYLNLTRSFLGTRGMADHRDYRLIESSGATEGAPAAGTADLIVDITSSGATIRANALKVLRDGTMLRSEANLVAGLRADWKQQTRTALMDVLVRIEAEQRGRQNREVRAHIPADQIDAVKMAMGETCLVSGADPAELSAIVPADDVSALSTRLRQMSARRISVRQLDYVFEEQVLLYDRMAALLGW